jgi:hypothetical protein
MTIDNVINLAERRAPEVPFDEGWHAHLKEAMKQVRDAFAARRWGAHFKQSLPQTASLTSDDHAVEKIAKLPTKACEPLI